MAFSPRRGTPVLVVILLFFSFFVVVVVVVVFFFGFIFVLDSTDRAALSVRRTIEIVPFF